LTRTHDIAVVGAGPAGASAALFAARAGASVALFEPARADAIKPCGEGIMPSGVRVLHELGLDRITQDAAPFERLRYRVPSGASLELELERPGCAIPRSTLKRALDDALASEERIERIEQAARPTRDAQGYTLPLRDGTSVRASRTILATGLSQVPFAWAGVRQRGKRLGVRAHFDAKQPLDAVEVHMGAGGDVYLTPLAGVRINVAVLGSPSELKHSATEIVRRSLERYPRAAARLGASTGPQEARDLSRGTAKVVARDGAFLVGDATGGVDPILGCGVTIALCTGREAALAAVAELRDGTSRAAHYARFVKRQTRVRRIVATSLQMISAHPWLAETSVRVLDKLPWLTRALLRLAEGEAPSRRAGDPATSAAREMVAVDG